MTSHQHPLEPARLAGISLSNMPVTTLYVRSIQSILLQNPNVERPSGSTPCMKAGMLLLIIPYPEAWSPSMNFAWSLFSDRAIGELANEIHHLLGSELLLLHVSGNKRPFGLVVQMQMIHVLFQDLAQTGGVH